MVESDAKGPLDYRYKPLGAPDSKGEPKTFRLLTVLPGSGDEPIECHIDTHDLPRDNEAPRVRYEALSWTWGEHGERKPIFIVGRNSGDDRRMFSVKPNLHQALERMRFPKQERVLWVDYVCINQADSSEKDQQVKVIFHIYHRASNVCIWLGEHEHSSEKAIDFIKNKVNDLGNYEEITQDEKLKDEWKALAALMDRKWFRRYDVLDMKRITKLTSNRRWVVQELALAKRATVYCGNDEMSWNDFEIAVSLFQRDAARLAGYYQAQKKEAFDHEIFGDVNQMGATMLVQLRSNLFRFNDSGEISEWRFTLGDLVSNLWSYEAKEPHDMIYAILSLAGDTHRRMSTRGEKSPVQEQFPSDALPLSRTHSATLGPSPQAGRASKQATPVKDTRSSKRKANASSPTRIDEGSDLTDSPASTKKRRRADAKARSTPSRQGTRSLERVVSEPISDTGTADEESLTDEERRRREKLLAPVVGKFRGTLKPENKTIFHVEYRQPFFAVCRQFLQFTIPKMDYHNLDILLRPWAPEIPAEGGEPALPSWIPMVSKAAFERTSAQHAPGGFKTTRVNADPLVGQSIHGSRMSYYNACKTHKAERDEWELGNGGDSDKRLFVKGFVLDIINDIKDASLYGSVSPAWLILGGWSRKQPTSDQVVDALWRTLVADRGPDGGNTKEYYRKAFEQAVENSPGGGINTTDLRHRGHPILVEFLKRVEAVVTNRRMFKGKFDTKNLGLAPEGAGKGDCEYWATCYVIIANVIRRLDVCIIRGMSVPVVLRPVDTENGKHYEMIGECYVHTMMDGRATIAQQEQLERARKSGEVGNHESKLWTPQWFELH